MWTGSGIQPGRMLDFNPLLQCLRPGLCLTSHLWPSFRQRARSSRKCGVAAQDHHWIQMLRKTNWCVPDLRLHRRNGSKAWTVYGLQDTGAAFDRMSGSVVKKLGSKLGTFTHCVLTRENLMVQRYGDHPVPGTRREVRDTREDLSKHFFLGRMCSPTRHVIDTKAWRCAWCTWQKIGRNYAAKELARDVSKPTERSELALKRVCRFLLLHMVIPSPAPPTLRGNSDTDWAACGHPDQQADGQHLIGSSSSTTQNVVALSSGESDYNALVKTCSCLLGLQALAYDFGRTLSAQVFAGSAACKEIASRRGGILCIVIRFS